MKDITNKKFGRLTAIKFGYIKHNYCYYWLFRCDCGNEKYIQSSNVTNGSTKSCGCYRKEITAHNLLKYKLTHGMSNTRFYNIWKHIQRRCNNSNSREYKHYGGRKIKCLWNSFEEFKNDMYKSYIKHYTKFDELNTTIDRIDNDGNYCKENCRWATKKEQSRNMRRNHLLTFNGETLPFIVLAERFNLKFATLYSRIMRLNWSVEKALTTPPRIRLLKNK